MIDPDLTEGIRQKRTILFVGAGVSNNVGVPTTEEMVPEIARQLGYDPGEFHTLGDIRMLAEFYVLTRGNLGPLRSWMDVTWHRPEFDVRGSEIHRLIVELDFPIIYTTNYDRWLERAYDAHEKKYTKIAGVADVLHVRAGATQIVKFHGDFDDDETLVLTESSFFERLSFENPLDLKLQADVLGRPVLFIGYSMTDINIRYLLYKLHRLWQVSALRHIRPKSYVFLSKPNPVQERILRSQDIEPIVSEAGDPAEGLKRFLSDLREAAR